MSELIILVILAALVVGVGVLTRLAVSSDGYGRRRPPVSHAPHKLDAATVRRVG
jgi:hypothetical protein